MRSCTLTAMIFTTLFFPKYTTFKTLPHIYLISLQCPGPKKENPPMELSPPFLFKKTYKFILETPSLRSILKRRSNEPRKPILNHSSEDQ